MLNEKGMVEAFKHWCNANAERFITDGLIVNVKQNPLATVEQVGADLEDEYVLATLSLWGWGDFEVIVMCKRNKETIFVEDLKVASTEELRTVLDGFYDRLSKHEPC